MTEPLDALVAAAAEGVAGEGLAVERVDEGYHLAVGDDERTVETEAALRGALADHPAHVAEWYFWARVAPEHPARRAFLRWLDPQDPPPDRRRALRAGVAREWGQLQVAVGLADDRRTYELRHVDDAERDRTALTVHESPEATRDIRTHDPDGDYRPLSTAPTLRRGWVVPGLDPEECVRGVDHCYPATIANWHREREGDLDVTHWAAAAERQTGIYDPVDDLSRAGVEAMAAACCADSECLKRRVWDASEGDELAAPRGEGVFPCREPCSLVVAAAREFVLTEREAPVGEDPSLRPREREQVARLVAAVAEGTVDDVGAGEVTDPANRLRVRYLRERWDGAVLDR